MEAVTQRHFQQAVQSVVILLHGRSELLKPGAVCVFRRRHTRQAGERNAVCVKPASIKINILSRGEHDHLLIN